MSEQPKAKSKPSWMKINEPMDKRPAVQSYEGYEDLPPIPVAFPSKGAIGKTGSWRTYRPVFDKEQCKGCNQCFLFCPEGTVIYKGPKDFEIDYDYCKGCGICASMCKHHGIKMIKESESNN